VRADRDRHERAEAASAGRFVGWTAAALLLVASATALADPFDGSQRLDSYNGVVIANARILGLAGAFVGVAEGQDGQLFNAACGFDELSLR
jgi:hypothetical protein